MLKESGFFTFVNFIEDHEFPYLSTQVDCEFTYLSTQVPGFSSIAVICFSAIALYKNLICMLT